MQVEELRIGNYLYYRHIDGYMKEEIVKICSINNEYLLDKENCTLGYNELKPIPLTEEVLLKCGFEKNNIHKDPSMYEYCIDYMPYIRTIDNSKTFEISFYATRIEYLHQLQNLYFALTGKELEIKL